MAIDQKKMLQAVYDSIFDALTTPPSGLGNGQPIESKETSYFSLAFPGNAIDINQFANAWSPDNLDGSTYAAENFSNLVDAIPVFNPLYASSGQSIDQLYSEIINANVTPPPHDSEAQAAYNKAFDTLFIDGNDYDENGKLVKVKVESPIYRNYKNKKAAYSAALLSYQTNYLQYDLSKPDQQRKWTILAPTLQAPVDTAYQDLQAARPAVVDNALATLSQYQASSLASIFSRAKQIYEQTKRGSVVQSGLFWHYCEAFPGNWFTESALANFTHLTIESSSLRINENSRFSSYTGGGSLSYGLWRVKASGSNTSEKYDLSTETSDLKISFKLGRIEIRRRWLNPSLFSLKGWSVAGREPGAYSNGRINENRGIFPLLPTAFIVARDIQISGKWGKKDLEQASQSTSASASVGWGPFTLSGSYQNSSSSRNYSSTFDGTTISVPGIQIIGWVSSINPLCPPRSQPQTIQTSIQIQQPSQRAVAGQIRRRNPYHDQARELVLSQSYEDYEEVDVPAIEPAKMNSLERELIPVSPNGSEVLSAWTSAEI